MTTIDKSKPILVTGATGYIAGWIIKKLLDQGLTVHAAVRNPDNNEKLAHLNELASNSNGKLSYFKTDLLDNGSYAEAMENCELVFHTASPFTSKFKDAQTELIDPAVKGTQNVLEQANKTSSVKRVVLTSSCVAIYTDTVELDNFPNNTLTEKIWNTTASLEYQPYYYSKTLAEKKAWEISEKQSNWDMVVLNPSFVMGPPLNPKVVTSESMNLLKQLGDGTMSSGAPNFGFGLVDVRDIAEAHIKAGFTPTANGRNIISGHNTNLLEIAKILHQKFGDRYKIPNKGIPKWLLMIIGPIVDKSITRKFVRNNLNLEFRADNSKSIKELGMSYRNLEESMLDSFQSLVDNGVL